LTFESVAAQGERTDEQSNSHYRSDGRRERFLRVAFLLLSSLWRLNFSSPRKLEVEARMSRSLVCLLCALVLFLRSTETVNSSRLDISIYYESYCRYSREFFEQQLRPIYSEIRADVNLKFVPFGLAEVSKSKSNHETGAQKSDAV
jgi:Gamma interferon inducible lysosomal thiol reductase (GILT)